MEKYGLNEEDLIGANIRDDVKQALKQHFDASHFIIATISRQPSPEKGGFFVAESQVLDLQVGENTTIRNMGFAIDSSAEFFLAVKLAGISLLGGLAYLFLSDGARKSKKDITITAGLYFFSFLTMVLLPSLAGPIVGSFIFVPPLETLAISGWWVVLLAVLMTMVAPSLLFYGAVERLKPSSFLKYVEAGEITLLAIIQGLFCWVIFLYLIYASSNAEQFTVSCLSVVPFFLFNFWKRRLIGLELGQASLFTIELCIIFFLVTTASPNLILLGLACLLLAHFLFYLASGQVQKFNGIRIDAPAKASKRNATSQVGDKIIEAFSSAKTTRVFIITADDIDFGNHIFDRITSVTSKEGSALEIDAENCLSEYSLVSNVVGRHLDGTSDSFDAALGLASDFIPFGSLISERASTSGVKDNHIRECGFMHFKAYCETNHCSNLIIRNLTENDASSINWLVSLMQKSWATELKIHILASTDKVIALFSSTDPMTYHLEHMDEGEAKTFLGEHTSLNEGVLKLIISELSNESGYFLAQDLRYFAQLASTLKNENEHLSDFDLIGEIKSSIGGLADKETLNNIDEICREHAHRQFLALASYIGPEIDLSLLCRILDTDMQSVFRLIDEINQKHQVFFDPKSARLCVVFRSAAFYKICYQYFQFHEDVSQQTSFSQVIVASAAKEILATQNITDERRQEILNYLIVVDNVDREWMLHQLLLDVKQQLFKGNLELAETFSQMAKIIKEKTQPVLSGSENKRVEREFEVVDILRSLMDGSDCLVDKGKKIEKFFRRWEYWPQIDVDIVYLMLRSLYNARFDLTTAPFSLKKISEKLLEIDNEYPPWFKAELIHYQQLAHLFIAHDSNDIEQRQDSFNSLRTALELLETETDSPTELASFSRIATTIINGDPYSQDIYELADKAIEIKSRLFDTEGVAITRGAIARASFFAGERLFKDGKKAEAQESFNTFLIRADEWKSESQGTSAPLSVLVMADNLKAQAFLYLSQTEPENVGNIKNAFSLIKSVMEMNLDPDTNDMNLFRQLASAKAILFELQLLDKKLTKEFPLKGTQQFYEKFGAHLEPFLKNKFTNLIKLYKLGWNI